MKKILLFIFLVTTLIVVLLSYPEDSFGQQILGERIDFSKKDTTIIKCEIIYSKIKSMDSVYYTKYKNKVYYGDVIKDSCYIFKILTRKNIVSHEIYDSIEEIYVDYHDANNIIPYYEIIEINSGKAFDILMKPNKDINFFKKH